MKQIQQGRLYSCREKGLVSIPWKMLEQRANNEEETYIGLSENSFETRYTNHTKYYLFQTDLGKQIFGNWKKLRLITTIFCDNN